MAADIKPRPPTSIRHSSTSWPKPLHWLQVSKGVSPVTQVAEVAVNSAGKKAQGLPLREDAGSISSSVPDRIFPRKQSAISLVARMGFLWRFTLPCLPR